LFEQVKKRSSNLNVRYAPPDDLDAIKQAITPATRLVWLEMPTNPLLKLPDIAEIARIARENGADAGGCDLLDTGAVTSV
jgi:cystathionine gamma-lyase